MSRLKPKPGGPLDITLTVGGNVVGEGQVPVSSPLLFTANDWLYVGTCLSSPRSTRQRAPLPFNGTVHRMRVAHQ
jgi:hypothetical protein